MKRAIPVSVTLALMCACVAPHRPLPQLQEVRPPQVQDDGATSSGSPEILSITLDAVIRLASENAFDIAMAREAIRAASARALAEYERFVPTVQPTIRFNRLDGETQGTEGEFVDVEKQNVFAGGGVGARLQVGEALFASLAARRREAASVAELGTTDLTTTTKAASLYLDLLRETHTVEALREAVEISGNVAQEMRAALDLGMAVGADHLRALARLSSNEVALERARERQRQTSIRLASLLRLDVGVELKSQEALIPLPLLDDPDPSLVAQAVGAHPGVTAAVEELNAARLDARAATWAPLVPDLHLEATYGGFGLVPSSLEDQTGYQAMLGWRIGPGGILDPARRKAAASNVRLAEIRLAKTEQAIQEDTLRFVSGMQSQKKQLDLTESQLRYALETLKLSEERQKSGVAIPLELIQAEEALTRAKLDRVNAVADYNVSQIWLTLLLRSCDLNLEPSQVPTQARLK